MTQLPTPPASAWATRPGRHIVSLSGGKHSTALVIELRPLIPQRTVACCATA